MWKGPQDPNAGGSRFSFPKGGAAVSSRTRWPASMRIVLLGSAGSESIDIDAIVVLISGNTGKPGSWSRSITEEEKEEGLWEEGQ